MSTSIHDLPKELHLNIIRFLDTPSIIAVAKISYRFHRLALVYLQPFYGEVPQFFEDLQSATGLEKEVSYSVFDTQNLQASGVYRNINSIKEIFSIQIPGPYSLISYLDAINEAVKWTLARLPGNMLCEFDHLIPPKLLDILYDELKEFSSKVYVSMGIMQMMSPHGAYGINQMFQIAITCALAAADQFERAAESVSLIKNDELKIDYFGPTSPRDLGLEKISRIAGRVGRVQEAVGFTKEMSVELHNENFSVILSELLEENDIEGACELLINVPWNEGYAQILSNHSQRYAEMGKMEEAYQLADEINDEEVKKATLIFIEELQK